jgi:hypothetical protein
LAHKKGLVFPIFTIVTSLKDTQRVDPEILNTQKSREMDYITENARKYGGIQRLLSRLNVFSRGAATCCPGSPSMTERDVCSSLTSRFLQFDICWVFDVETAAWEGHVTRIEVMLP